MPPRSPILPAASVALVLGLVLLSGSPALAGPRDARLKYQQGQELFAQKKYGEAARAFQRALAAGGDRVILFDLGRAQQAAGMNEEALASYEAFLRAAPMSPLRFEVRASVKQIRARLRSKAEPAPPGVTIVPTAPPEPSTPPATAPPPVTPATPVTVAPPVTPVPTSRTPPAPPLAIAPPVPPSPAAAVAEAPTRPAPASAPRGSDSLRNAAITLVVSGALLTGGGIGFLAGAAVRSDEVERAVRFDPEVDASGRRFQTAGSVLTIVGVAALLVGGELFRRHAADKERQTVVAAP